ncbi:MAG TPA: major capsid family protein [Candidatus Limnocylindria bacterium]|nr:major capsid family protein [Candidatus Limnocylindria bacterium]
MVAHFHDVSPGRSVVPEAFYGALGRALRFRGEMPPAETHYDAAGLIGMVDTCEAYHRHVDGLVLHELGRSWRPSAVLLDLARRADALPAGVPGFPREFEFVRSRILEEKRQPLTAMAHLPIDSSVPLGARTHTWRRALGAGEAQIYRGGTEFPRARVTRAEEQFGVVHVVCAVDTNFFDTLTTNFAGLRQYQEELRLARRLVEERLNRIAWFGDAASKVYGALTHPALAKMVLSTPFTDASDPEEVALALADFVATPMLRSAGTFSSNALLVSPKIDHHIRTRPTTLAMNMFVRDLFLAGQRGRIEEIEVAPELEGIGPNGEDGMLAYRKDLDTMGHVVVQTPTPLPVFPSSPVDQTTVMFGSSGGVTYQDVGNAVLGLVVVQ